MLSRIEIRKNEFSDAVGIWSAHNIHLGEDIFTIKNGIVNDEYKLKRVIQNIYDCTGKNFSEIKILDLACLEGLFGIECAMQGADVTFLDARDENLRKVEFVTKVLNLEKVKIVKDDVRNISVEKYGKFDVILCLGIFYHLDWNDLFPFIVKMYEMTDRIVYFDTHVCFSRKSRFSIDGCTYYGSGFREHRTDATQEEKTKDLWKSIDNEKSFMLTKCSLMRMLNIAGFTSVVESYLPCDRTKSYDRISLIAFKNKIISPITIPQMMKESYYNVPEERFISRLKDISVSFGNKLIYSLRMNSPRFIRDFYRRLRKNRRYKTVSS